MSLQVHPVFIDIEVDSVKRFPQDPLPSITELAAFDPFQSKNKRFKVICQSKNYPQRQKLKYPNEKIYSFKEGWNQFTNWFENKKIIILSYNLNPSTENLKPGEDQLPGDWAKISAACAQYQIPLPDVFFFDVLKLVEAFNLKKKIKLENIREYFGLPSNGKCHRADVDVDVLYKVFVKLCGSAPLEQVFKAMAKPGDNTQLIASLIKSYQVVKPIFFNIKAKGEVAPPDQPVQPEITYFEAHIPSFKTQTTFKAEIHSIAHFKQTIIDFKAFVRSYNPLARVVMISTNVYDDKQKILDNNLDRVGKRDNWAYFDLIYFYNKLFKTKLVTQQDFLQQFQLDQFNDISFSQKLEKCFLEMIGNAETLPLYRAMLAPSHNVMATAKLIKPAPKKSFKPIHSLSSFNQANSHFYPVFLHFDQGAVQGFNKQQIQVFISKKSQSYTLQTYQELNQLLSEQAHHITIVAYDLFQKSPNKLIPKELSERCKFFDVSFLANALYGYVMRPGVVLNPARIEREREKQKSNYNKYLEYYIDKSPLTLEELFDHYHIDEIAKSSASNQAEKLSMLFEKMMEVLSEEQLEQGIKDPHPYKTLASLIKTNRKSISIFWDTETTGLWTNDPMKIKQLREGTECTPRIIEIGACKVDSEGKKDFFETFIDPQCKIPEDAIQIHHITDKMVQGKPVFKRSWENFLQWIRKDVPDSAEIRFIGHNQEGYDRVLAYLSCRFSNLSTAFPINATFFDTLIFSRSLHKKNDEDKNNEEPRFSSSLANLAEVYHIVNENPHRAIGDVKTTMKFYEVATKDIPKDLLKKILNEPKSEKALAQAIRAEVLAKLKDNQVPSSKLNTGNEKKRKRQPDDEPLESLPQKKLKVSPSFSKRGPTTRSQTRRRVILD